MDERRHSPSRPSSRRAGGRAQAARPKASLLLAALGASARLVSAGGAAAASVAEEAFLPSDGLAPQQVVVWNDTKLIARLPSRWMRLRGPIGTVCVTGDDRRGKSTLLTLWGRNLTEAEDFAFPTGHTWTSHTKGFWSAILPTEVTGLDYHLNLCDSQGLKQLPELEQWRLFSANVLLPSVLVYLTIDVVQNDQLRDLARMAHQFQLLSSEDLGRFGRVLSPHLLVVVRDESNLDGKAGSQGAKDLSTHLEEALSGPGFTEDKALIRQVFRTREAMALQELPLEARLALRAGGASLAPGGLAAESSRAWRTSGEAILERVLVAMDRVRDHLPTGGPELSQWYRSVLETVNSHEDGSMGRLVGHGELLAEGHRRRRLLREWRGPALIALASAALLLALGGFLGRWLDRAAWCTWIVLCVCQIGTSPLVTTPLSGIIPERCEQLTSSGGTLARLACREASAHTAALLLAAVLGALSYPMLTAQLQWLLGLLHLPSPVQRSGAACALVAAVGILGILQDVGLGDADGEEAPLVAILGTATLTAAAALSGAELALKARYNRLCLLTGDRGRALHCYLGDRLPEVQRLQESREWATHYRRHQHRDALWRYRCVPLWRPAAVCSQACSLLAWAWLIHPHGDPVLALGIVANGLHLAWRVARATLRCATRREEVDEWFRGLQDASDGEEPEVKEAREDEEAEEEEEGAPTDSKPSGAGAAAVPEPALAAASAGASGPVPARRRRRAATPEPSKLAAPPEQEEESDGEVQQRRAIEDMRRAQERLVPRAW